MSQLSELINKIVKGSKVNDVYIVGTVTAVDGVLCDVQPVDENTAELKGIRLCAEDSSTVFIIVPSVGSVVYVTMDSDTGGIVTGFSQVEEVLLRGDAHGGLVKVSSLVADLNSIKNDINTLKTAFSSWVVVPTDGGAALKAITAAWYGVQLSQSTVNNLQNDKVKHG